MADSAVGPQAEAELLICNGGSESHYALHQTQVTLGRRPDCDVVLPHPHVSRVHARVEQRGARYYFVDQSSTHGSFVNGQPVRECPLRHGDRIELGALGGPAWMVFHHAGAPPDDASHETRTTSGSQAVLSRLMGRQSTSTTGGVNELQMLQLFIEGARSLNSAAVLGEVLTGLVDVSLRLTRAERGFVFLCRADGSLEAEAGRNDRGETLTTADGISHSVLHEVMTSASEFVLSTGDPAMEAHESIVAHNLRSIVCIPLRRSLFRGAAGEPGVIGVLYLDSRVEKGKLPDVSHELIRAIAREAASLVESASLAKAEQEALAYQRELAIASTIQQGMMQVKVPALEFAAIEARNICCKEVGGDFYDVMRIPGGVAVVLADVSGKGVSAALLACVLQGAIHPQLQQGLPLAQIADALNGYVQHKIAGMKYATMVILRLYEDGRLEYINCGHLKPLLRTRTGLRTLDNGNVPVGLLSPVSYTAAEERMEAGDRLLLYSDGIVEAEDASGEFFGNERLEALLDGPFTPDTVFSAVDNFRGDAPLNDDCTVLVLHYGRRG